MLHLPTQELVDGKKHEVYEKNLNKQTALIKPFKSQFD
jgi:hypothetical protein